MTIAEFDQELTTHKQCQETGIFLFLFFCLFIKASVATGHISAGLISAGLSYGTPTDIQGPSDAYCTQNGYRI